MLNVSRFSATVRLLVGSVLNIHMGAPKVYVSIVNETQANQLLSHARFGHQHNLLPFLYKKPFIYLRAKQ